MAQRAAIVTGGSSGIGLAIAGMLGDEGYSLTVAARPPEEVTGAVDGLRGRGFEVQGVAADLAQEEEIKRVVSEHSERYGRLDVLVNNAGVGFAAPVGEIQTKRLDMQLDINLRSIVLFYRECVEMLKAAGADHGQALVVNTASITGKIGIGGNSVYAATKHGVVGFTESMNSELNGFGIKSTALCPALVNTPMTDFVKEHVKAEEMIQTQDISEAVRCILRLSRMCVVPEIVFLRPGSAV
jgi:NAD(P)-dependent dehydrogenase (short-subunit alcohol dehydrogenase family)